MERRSPETLWQCTVRQMKRQKQLECHISLGHSALVWPAAGGVYCLPYRYIFENKHLTRLTWLIHTSFYLQNGICNQKYHFWPKNALEKFILKSFQQLFLLLNLWFWALLWGSSLLHRGITNLFFLDHFSPSFLGQKLYFWIQIPIWG